MSDNPLDTHDLIYDWNLKSPRVKPAHHIMVTDESLRDGLQSPSIIHPEIQDKVYLLYLMNGLGIDAADLGICGAGDQFKYHVTVLAREIVNQKMPIQPQSAARTLISDIAPNPNRSLYLLRDESYTPICRGLGSGFHVKADRGVGWLCHRKWIASNVRH
jgi:hypothetical protein